MATGTIPSGPKVYVVPGTDIGVTAGETLLDKLQRAVSQGVIPIGKPFIGYFASSAYYYCTGHLAYYSNGYLYGEIIAGTYTGGTQNFVITAGTWSVCQPKTIISTGTSNGWAYDKYSDGTITARKNLSGSVTEYSTANGFHCFYIADIATPFTMDNATYTVLCDWKIGTGFSIPAGALSKTTSKFNAYALGTASGTVSYQLSLYLVGACSAAT